MDTMRFGQALRCHRVETAHIVTARKSVIALARPCLVLPFFAIALTRMRLTRRKGFLVLLCVLTVMTNLFAARSGPGLNGIAPRIPDSVATGAILLNPVLSSRLGTLPLPIVFWWQMLPGQSGTRTYGPNPQEVFP